MILEAEKIEQHTDSQRLNDVLLHYWEGARDGGAIPYESEINIAELKSIWDSCFLVHHERVCGEQQFSYLHLGKDLVEAYGGKKAQRDVCASLIFPTNLSLEKEFRQVVRLKSMQQVANRLSYAGSADVLYRSIMLPLLGKDNTIEYILGGMRWKFCQ
jgi:hypothetical protein